MAFDSKRRFLTYSLNENFVKTKEEIDKVKIDRLTDYKQAKHRDLFLIKTDVMLLSVLSILYHNRDVSGN
jgi:hypothetical protein